MHEGGVATGWLPQGSRLQDEVEHAIFFFFFNGGTSEILEGMYCQLAESTAQCPF